MDKEKKKKVVHVSSRFMNTSTTTVPKKKENQEKSTKLKTTTTKTTKIIRTKKFKTVQPKFMLNTSSTSFLNSSQLDTSFNTSTIFVDEKEKKKVIQN